MPTYEYLCEKCGHRFDYFQSMNDPKLTDCPLEECDGKVRRLLGTGAGVIFKGGGFYETDYRSESYKSAQKKEAEAAKPKEEKSKEGKSKEGKKSESKKADSGGSAGGGGSSSTKGD